MEHSNALSLWRAGENVIGKSGIVSFFDKLKEKMFDTDHNMFANWLKHPSGPRTATISELEVVVMIQPAISKFAAVAGGATVAMKNFSAAQLNKIQPAAKA